MRDNKKYIKPIILAAAAMLAVTGCNGKGKESETSTETVAQTTKATEAVLEKVTYTAADGSVSIILPDSTWKNTVDENGKLTFVSEGKGEITVEYASTSDAVDKLAMGSTEARLKKKLKKLGVDSDNVDISNFKYDKSTGIKICSYSLKYKDTTAGNFYTTTSITAVEERGYQVSGTIKLDDTALLASVQESVNSFLVLKNALSTDAAEKNAGTGTGDETSASEGSSDASSGSSGEGERYFFDEKGNTIYTSQNSDGVWVDKYGTSYKFYENDVEDSNGTKYYYDPPSYRSNDSGNSSGSGSSSDSGDTADYYDFYDKDGNYIKTHKDENGNWADDNGKTYTFGDTGVTDSDGNFHPY